MTPHQVLSLLTQDQTHDLMCACATYLSPDRVLHALKDGLEPDELKELAKLLNEHLCLDEADET